MSGRLPRWVLRILPQGMAYADHLTLSGRILRNRVLLGGAGVILGIAAVALLRPESWAEVAAGALVAWSTSIIVWAFGSFRRRVNVARDDLRHAAELDLLHARFNQIAAVVGAPPLALRADGIDSAIAVRMERLAHFAGLDEFRPQLRVGEPGWTFWDEVAIGTQRPTGD